jgi:hypothetical protein
MAALRAIRDQIGLKMKLAQLRGAPRLPIEDALKLANDIVRMGQSVASAHEDADDLERAVDLYQEIAEALQETLDKVPVEDRELLAPVSDFWSMTADRKREALQAKSKPREAQTLPIDWGQRPPSSTSFQVRGSLVQGGKTAKFPSARTGHFAQTPGATPLDWKGATARQNSLFSQTSARALNPDQMTVYGGKFKATDPRFQFSSQVRTSPFGSPVIPKDLTSFTEPRGKGSAIAKRSDKP